MLLDSAPTPAPTGSNGIDDSSILRLIVEGTAQAVGDDFFRLLVKHLAAALGAQFVMVAEFTEESRRRVRTLAYWVRDHVAANIEYDLAGTPCQDVIDGGLCHYPDGVAARFPQDKPLAQLGIESYLGVPLLDADGTVLGHLAVFDERPMPQAPRLLSIFQIFAARAAAELQRLRREQQLRQSEQQYRDLFNEAPIAYVYEGTDTQFISVNRTGMNLLGLRPEEVESTVGMSLVADTPENKARLESAFADIRAGKERGLTELELRRKDDGRPVWVQFWSRPEPDGKHTRTMIIDVTARVLAEREQARLRQQNEYLQSEISDSRHFDEIVGKSAALAEVVQQVRAVAPTDSTVLIHGETGTGKELFARAIHSASRRCDKPLIKVNCAALPVGLVESELFGHEKGAFTGALAKRVGRFELADGGTIFLDEIGELPLETQSKLLRVLQEREFERVGGAVPTSVDVRVIAATNRDLAMEVREKRFREDLFYRLSVFPIKLPSLRERMGDVPLLAHYFTGRLAAQVGKQILGIHPTTMERLVAYSWPGNIRELQNVVERAVILCRGDLLEVDSRQLATPADAPSAASSVTLDAAQRSHIEAALTQTGWVIDGDRGAAKILGTHPNTLRSRMKKLGIERPSS
jgi:formate hydrogenlyase transcriptional activator